MGQKQKTIHEKSTKKIFLFLVITLVIILGVTFHSLINQESSYPQKDPFKNVIFQDGFENAAQLSDLQKEDGSRWHATQQNDAQNTLEIEHAIVHSGENALKATAVPTNEYLSVSKSDIQKEFLPFKKGDDVWFSGWYYVPSGTLTQELFIWDLEDSTKPNSAGLRLFFSGGGNYLALEQKFPPRGKVKQKNGIPFPKDAWVNVKIHLTLSDTEGLVQVWQDDQLILEDQISTLYEKDMNYDRLQVGITANGKEKNQSTVVYLDDITLSNNV